MADPFSIISLVGGVAQLIDFGLKVVHAFNQNFRSSQSGCTEATDLDALTRSLSSLCDRLEVPEDDVVSDEDLEVQDEQAICNLATRCRALTLELLSTLAKLRRSPRRSRWNSFTIAVKSTWRQKEIDSINRRLNSFRLELILQMQSLTRNDGRTLRAIDALRIDSIEFKTAFAAEISHCRNEVLQIAQHIGAVDKSESRKPRFAARSSKDPSSTVLTFGEQATAISKLADRGKTLSNAIDILRSLRFADMDYRQAHITQAYPKTYEWAHASLLSAWMESSHPLFWITGKPGSGKSTLMKYVVESEETGNLLSRWAGSSDLLVSSHFFWTNGSSMQRSLAGLLRKILFAVFRKYPELMEDHAIQAELSQFLEQSLLDYSMLENEWTTEKLLSVFRTILQQTSNSHKFVIFIDGIDEYDGDHAMLAQEIIALGSTANLKLCVASRPWNVFEVAFGSGVQKIYMHQLTQGDIHKYVNQKFEAPLVDLPGLAPEQISSLAEEIIDKAQGVFLWVALVVKSLLAGFENADKLSDLRRRLAEFPPDLDDYFRFILDSVDPFYRHRASIGFHAALNASTALTINQFWYLDEEDDDPDYATSKPYPPAETDLGPDKKLAIVERRVNARYKGLLEVNGMQVDFLHASVKDFLSTQGCQDWLARWTPKNFQVHESLTKAYLADLKDVCPGDGWSISHLSHFYILARNLLRSAEKCALQPGSLMTPIYLELDRLMDIDSGNDRGYLTAAPFYGLVRDLDCSERFIDAVLSSSATCNLERKREWCAKILLDREKGAQKPPNEKAQGLSEGLFQPQEGDSKVVGDINASILAVST